MVPRLVGCALVLTAFLQGARLEESSIIFGDPDLSTTISSEQGEFHLDAFKAAGNDRILQSNDPTRLSQLQWFSLGEPKLVGIEDRRNASEETVFDFKSDRVTVKISTLTPAHRKELAAVIHDKYGFNISNHQLTHLPLSRVHCQLEMRDYAGQLFLLTSNAEYLQTSPIRVDFIAPKSSPTRNLLERMVTDHPEELSVDCSFYSKGKEVVVKTLEVSSEQINRTGIIDTLFESGEHVHVTREQLIKLSLDMYSVLSILEEYEMPQHEFSEAFVSELLQQTMSTPFSDVNVDDALSGLSSYTLDATVTSDDIKEALSSLYSVETVTGRKQIKLNQSAQASWRQHAGISAANTAIATLFSISIGPTSRMTTGNIVSPSLSLEDQLAELNSFPESAVRWNIDGNRLVPKSLRVAELWRENFKKTIHFHRIFREVTEAPFAQMVRMEIGDTVQLETRASQQREQQQEIVKLKSDLDRLTKQMQQQPKQDELQASMEQLQQQQEERQQEAISKLESIVEALTKQLRDQQEQQLERQQQLQGHLVELDALVAQQQHQLQRQQEAMFKLQSHVAAMATPLQHLQYAPKHLGELYQEQQENPDSQLLQEEQRPASLPSTPREALTQEENILIREWEGNIFENYKSAGSWRDGSTVLHFASEEGPIEVVGALLARGDDVNAQRSDGRTPLHLASFYGKTDIVALLIQYGADVNQKDKSDDGATPLHKASYNGKTDVVALLIQNGANVNSKKNDGSTPLHVASFYGKADIVALLIQNGADVNQQDKGDDGSTPLHKASYNGKTDVVKLLIQDGADVNRKKNDGSTPLQLASYQDHAETAEVLINAGANVNSKDHNGDTSLHKASSSGNIDVITLLIRHGADVNSKKNNGMTPLHEASWNGQTGVVSLLIRNGADITAKQDDGGTPLHEASYHGKADVVALLIQNGANVNHRNNDGWTALHWASYHDYPAIAEALIKAGANVDEKNKAGQTPLHVASSKGRTGVVSVLLRSKADANIKDKNGKTPKDIAGNDEIKRLLGS